MNKFRAWVKFESGNYGMLDNEALKDWTLGMLFGDESEECDVVMQWTGFVDKDGAEIYEGDIVEVYDDSGDNFCLGCVGVIVKIDSAIHFCGDDLVNKRLSTDGFICGDDLLLSIRSAGTGAYAQDGEIDSDNLKIIGNIFENPDKTTQKKSDLV